MFILYRYIRNVIPQTEVEFLVECEGMMQSWLYLVSYVMFKHNKDTKLTLEHTNYIRHLLKNLSLSGLCYNNNIQSI